MAKDVLMIIEGRIATVHLLEQVLEFLSQNHGITWRTRLDSDVKPEDVREDTLPIIIRGSAPGSTHLARIFGEQGNGYAYYVDDNFWLLAKDTELGRFYSRAATRRPLNALVRNAKAVIVSTPALAQYLTQLNPFTVHLDAPVAFEKYPPMQARAKRGPRVRMGFAASAFRGVDLEPLLPVILEALDRHPHLEFEVIGIAMSIPNHPRIRMFPYLNSYEEYVEFQRARQWDFALAPLGDAPANAYKTDVKFREYAAQYIPGIYQRSEPYSRVQSGVTGLLAGEPDEWLRAIDRYVTDDALRLQIRSAARADAEARYALAHVGESWLRMIDAAPSVASDAAQLAEVRLRVAGGGPIFARAAWRMRLLWLHGRTELRTQGAARTARDTARFLARKVARR